MTGLDTPIEEIDFGAGFIKSETVRKQVATRARNGLQRAGIMTLGQLLEHSRSNLKDSCQGLGIITILAIEHVLEQMGHKLREHDGT